MFHIENHNPSSMISLVPPDIVVGVKVPQYAPIWVGLNDIEKVLELERGIA